MIDRAKELFSSLPLLAILRGISDGEIEPIAEIALKCGVPALEVTLNTPDPFQKISRFRKAVDGKMAIGAGTVLDLRGMEKALEAGAEFIVSPVLVPEVAQLCQREKVPYFPGAFTPQEVWEASLAGAAMVKLFPAGTAGPRYCAELKGPFDAIPLMAVGGVESNNVAEFFRAGADAVACGGSVFRREWLDRRDYGRVEASLGELAEAIRTVQSIRNSLPPGASPQGSRSSPPHSIR